MFVPWLVWLWLERSSPQDLSGPFWPNLNLSTPKGNAGVGGLWVVSVVWSSIPSGTVEWGAPTNGLLSEARSERESFLHHPPIQLYLEIVVLFVVQLGFARSIGLDCGNFRNFFQEESYLYQSIRQCIPVNQVSSCHSRIHRFDS